jgi:phage gpG-like protein
MAKSMFTTQSLYGQLPKSTRIVGTASINNLIKIELKANSGQSLASRIEAAINRANSRIAVDLKAALDAAIRSGVWSTPSGSADIYETGELMSSGSVTVDANGVTIAYSAPYAALVHFGGYINPYGNTSVKVYLPPRPWIESVMFGGGPVPAFDFKRYYDEEIRREFSS